VPGLYQVRLTVDGKTQTTPLKIEMDPRSPATAQVLAEQFEFSHKIFVETIDARRALAEIGSVQKQLAEIQQKLTPRNPKQRKEDAQPTQLQSALSKAQTDIGNILVKKSAAGAATAGLQNAYTGLASALRVAESGDREVPSQAVAVYQESSQQVKAALGEWTAYKQAQLPELNRRLHEANLSPVAIAEIEQQVEVLATR
jgi:hypothetical protein